MVKINKKENELIRENGLFKLHELTVTTETQEKNCEVCGAENESVLYWLQSNFDNCDVFMCKKCFSKLKELVNSK